jgi:hypothetical protein
MARGPHLHESPGHRREHRRTQRRHVPGPPRLPGRQLQAGIEAEETIQLPPRDTKKSEKLQDQEGEDNRRGREQRERHGKGMRRG